MKFSEILDFLETKMSMSHIYQPLLIKTLVDAGGSVTIRQLSNAFLSHPRHWQFMLKLLLNYTFCWRLNGHGLQGPDNSDCTGTG
jgi:hypothetical protein